jgi:hypothetical protein
VEVQDIQTPYTRAKIRDLNDLLRKTFVGGLLVMTRSVACLDQRTKDDLISAVQRFNAFDEKNDPYAEHDFGKVLVHGQAFYFKIDYYDRSMEMHSPDPSNPTVTKRVLTIMKPEDY